MSFLRFLLISSLSIMIFQSSVQAQDANNCLSKEETEAFNFRFLQTNYMVAALSCEGMRDNYNFFVEKFSDNFIKNGIILKKYFTRVYGIKATYNLDKFITQLANSISMSSAENPKAFCKRNIKSINYYLKQDVLLINAFDISCGLIPKSCH